MSRKYDQHNPMYGNQKSVPEVFNYKNKPTRGPSPFVVSGHFVPQAFDTIIEASQEFRTILSRGNFPYTTRDECNHMHHYEHDCSDCNHARVVRCLAESPLGPEEKLVYFLLLFPLDGEGLPSHFLGHKLTYQGSVKALYRTQPAPAKPKYNRNSSKSPTKSGVRRRGYSD